MAFRKRAVFTIIVVCLAFVFTGIVFEIAGYIFIANKERHNQQTIKDTDTYKILCVGESTTAMGGKNAYPQQLERILNNRISHNKISVINKGIPGHTTTSILDEIKENIKNNNPDMVIAMMGINDGTIWANNESLEKKSFWARLRILRFIELLWVNINQGNKGKEASENLGESISKKSQILSEQGWRLLEEHVDLIGAKTLFQDALVEDQENIHAMLGLGTALNRLKKTDNAIVILTEAAGLQPANPFLRDELIRSYVVKKDKDEVTRLLHQQFQKKYPVFIYFEPLDVIAAAWGKEETEMILKKISESRKGWSAVDLGLAYFYFNSQNYSDASKNIEIYLNDYQKLPDVAIYGIAGQIYKGLGEVERAKEFFKKSELASMKPVTAQNYLKLRDIVLSKGLVLVAVQYPVRSIEPLKYVLGDDPRIIYVDNERKFKEALKMQSYDTLFIDSFAGDFGHATVEGNRILASNVAQEIFNRKVL